MYEVMSASAYRHLLETLDGGVPAVMLTLHSVKRAAPERLCLSAEELGAAAFPEGLPEDAIRTAREALRSGSLGWHEAPGGGGILAEPSFPEPRLIVLGGGHIAKPLVEFSARLGYRVTVCDDRPSFASKARFPEADKVICEFFDDFLGSVTLNSSTYVAIVTRGHRHDMDCYRKVAPHDVAYVGMIGSHRRIAALKAQLLEEGFAQERLAALHAPIGMDIGAVTPEEIALSIMAEVVQARRKGDKPGSAVTGAGELDREVLKDLSREEEDPRAVVTIVGTKGSAPRKEGAKMVVWPYGKTLGSIGGGCSEGEVIIAARDVIREGGFRLRKVDMTGDLAEDEGMACGGVMEVLIEAY